MIEWLLGGGLVASSGAFIALAFLNRKDNRELVMAQRTISDTQTLANEYKAQRDQKAAALDVTSAQLVEEKQGRDIADAQRNEAQRRLRALLPKHMESASNEEIAALVDDLFAPIGVPHVPEASHPAASDTDLEKPM